MKFVSLTFLSLGMFLIVQIFMPIIAFEIWNIGQKFDSSLISPQPENNSAVLGVSIKTEDNFPSFVSTLTRLTKPNYSQFSITVPKINIEGEKVLVDSNDLSKTLAQLPGSALPGEKGNLFISGHSALSQFFELRKAVFGKLADLKKGDQIMINAGGVNYVYEVVGFKVVNPNDVSVINPPEEQGRYISLMTCVPPGLNFKRLVVLGKML